MAQSTLTRRGFALGVGGVALTGCASTVSMPETTKVPAINRSLALMYAAQPQERFPLPAINIRKVPTQFYRQQVNDPTGEAPGTLVVNTRTFFLHLVQGNGKAMRYGVGLGRQGFEWSGRARVGWKQVWPKWTPPDEMIAREPELEKWSARNGGMPPGLDNPLGARALYIFQGKVDTLYRIHGSPEFWTIGKAVSSGCVRMMNQDVIDLYDRVPTHSRILVM